jgi:hypothetical protein
MTGVQASFGAGNTREDGSGRGIDVANKQNKKCFNSATRMREVSCALIEKATERAMGVLDKRRKWSEDVAKKVAAKGQDLSWQGCPPLFPLFHLKSRLFICILHNNLLTNCHNGG